MISFANAKINLGLHVVGRRADGYHLLETAFYPFPLYDVIEINPALAKEEARLDISGLDLAVDDNNLCLKAYRLLREKFDLPPVHIQLHKQIPYGAGLGGGSSDAAFVLNMLNKMFNIGLSPVELEQEAAKLGADCPFFIQNIPRYAEGIGTDFSPLSVDLTDKYLVLVKPPVHISTADAYRDIRPTSPKENLRDLLQLPIQEWKFYVKNDFEEGIFDRHPLIRDIKLALYTEGALYASMSGSGSAVYGIFSKPVDLRHLNSKAQVYYPTAI